MQLRTHGVIRYPDGHAMTSTSVIMLGVLALSFSLLGAVGSRALGELSWHELKEYCKRRQRRDRFDQIYDEYEQVSLGMETLRAIGAISLLLTVREWLLIRQDSEQTPEWQWLFGGGVLILLFGVWLPAAVIHVWRTPLLFRFWPVFRGASRLVWPFAVVTRLLEFFFQRVAGRPAERAKGIFEDEVMSIVTEGMHEGHLLADAGEMIESVIELPDSEVADIMTPRSEMNAFSVDLPWEEVLRFIANCRRTRIPVYEGDLDHIVGVLYVKDLIAEMAHGGQPRRPLRSMLRKAWQVPKTLKLDRLLTQFLQTRSHLAIVVEEHRPVAGLVTIEDVLEEIVGEIVDEYDNEEVGEIVRTDSRTAEVIGRAHLADVNEALNLDLPEPDDFDTIAGFVIKQLGRIPRAGDLVVWGATRITVLEATKRRVERVRIETGDSSLQDDPQAPTADVTSPSTTQ